VNGPHSNGAGGARPGAPTRRDAEGGRESGPSGAADTVETASVIAEVVAETARLRDSGALPSGFEADLDLRFLAIARDPEELAREAAAGASSRRGSAGKDLKIRQLLPRAARRSRRAAGSVAHSTRRATAPRVRSIERSSIERAGRVAESVVTRAYVAADRVTRIASLHSSGRLFSRLARISPSGRALPPAPQRPARGERKGESTGADPADRRKDSDRELEDWAVERLTRSAGGPVVHVECGDGALVRRLAAAGLDAAGADPAGTSLRGSPAGDTADSMVRAGALECLGSCSRSSLGGLVLSGVTERLSPGRARALTHLAATRLRPGAVIVVLSAHPDDGGGDVVSADLSPGRALHPVTWCHLLSRYGLAELTVNDPVAQPSHRYAVAARLPGTSP
jgi:hypothetical protein